MAPMQTPLDRPPVAFDILASDLIRWREHETRGAGSVVLPRLPAPICGLAVLNEMFDRC